MSVENKKIDKVSLSKSKTNHLTSHESTQIQNLSIDNNWSWILYSKIFEYLKTKNIEIDIFEIEKENFHENHTLLFEKINTAWTFLACSNAFLNAGLS